MARLARLPQRPSRASPTAEAAAPIALADFALNLYQSRRRRDELFPPGLFGEPAWDILLDLFVADAAGNRVDVGSACIAAAVPQTTALRYVGKLVRIGLVERLPVPGDRRRSTLALTGPGRAAIAAILTELRARCQPD